MRVAIVENTAITHHGQVGVALHEAAAQITIFRPFADGKLPDPESFDALVVFGGEQAATADATHPYLPELAARMRDFTAAGRAVLGICLGSQVLARAYGGQNHLNAAPEHGWCAVDLTPAGQADPLFAGVNPQFRIMQMHADTFDLPPGAIHLAGSDRAPSQAFRMGRATYGTQFHFEASRAVVADWDRRLGHVIATLTPDWAGLYAEGGARYGASADATGLQLARNWVALI